MDSYHLYPCSRLTNPFPSGEGVSGTAVVNTSPGSQRAGHMPASFVHKPASENDHRRRRYHKSCFRITRLSKIWAIQSTPPDYHCITKYRQARGVAIILRSSGYNLIPPGLLDRIPKMLIPDRSIFRSSRPVTFMYLHISVPVLDTTI